MHKRAIHHFWTKIRPVGYGYFLGAFIMCGSVTLLALRQNNLNALRLRDKVVQTDEQNGDVEAALRELRTYVHSHMNTSLASGPGSIKPPVQLKYRYERLQRAEKERVSKLNEKVYTDAQTECERRIPSGTIAGRVPCVQEYVSRNTVREQPIPDALYKFDFQPPLWSPDLAGFSLLLTFIFFALFIIRFILEQWLKASLHGH